MLTVLVLSGGIYIFAVADELAATRMGTTTQKIAEAAGPMFENVSLALLQVGTTADEMGKDFKDATSAFSSYLKSDAAKSLPEKIDRDPELRKTVLNFVNGIDIRQVNSTLQVFSDAAKAASSSARDVGKSALSMYQESGLTLLAKSVSTRVMAVVLSIFLVQLLIGLYRYNTRMAAYYDGRRDAFELSQGGNKEMLEVLVPLLGAETLDFGKGPSSPVDRVVDIAKAIASKRG
jgi:hypothetical protein